METVVTQILNILNRHLTKEQTKAVVTDLFLEVNTSTTIIRGLLNALYKRVNKE